MIMGVDISTRVIYGYKIDTDKFMNFIEDNQIEDIYVWMEEQGEYCKCEFFTENHYYDIEDSNIYFGINIWNKITAQLLTEIDRDRKSELQDEMYHIFGANWLDMLDEQGIEPELQIFAEVW